MTPIAALGGRSRISIRDLDHDLARGCAIFDLAMSIGDRVEFEASRIDEGHDLSRLNKPCRLTHDVAVVCATLACQHRQKREDTRIGRGAE